jgi:hypothetical protein
MYKLRLAVIVGLLLLLAALASAQEWQSYQLTHFVVPGQVDRCESVADTFGHLHHYVNCHVGSHGDWANLYYLRTDFYGHLLTDTTLIYSRLDTAGLSMDVAVVTDGANAWCMYQARIPNEGLRCGLYMTARNSQGQEILPPIMLGERVKCEIVCKLGSVCW